MKRKFSSSDNCKEPYSRTTAATAERAVVVPESTALSRDNLGSDNSENDPAGDSEAILTCVGPSGPLEKSFCSDDNASDDGNEASDGGNSLQFPGGHPGCLAQTNDTLRPGFPRESHQCCQTCVAMTGTRLGLSALLSDGGYVHLNWYEIQKSAGMGCELCSGIWDTLESEDWDYEDDGSVTSEEIRIFANFTHLLPDAEGAQPQHPLEYVQLQSLEVKAPLDGGSSKGEIFYLVTSEGKLKSWNCFKE